MITVHHLKLSRSLRIIWLLEELGVDYRIIRHERDPATGLAPTSLQALHPMGKSPLIEMDGAVIAESAAIVEVICARHGPQLIPDRSSKAYLSHLQLMHFAEGSAMGPIAMRFALAPLGSAADPIRPRVQAELTRILTYMEQMLRPSGHWVLDGLSAADIMLSFPAEVVVQDGREAEFPEIAAFLRAIKERPAYQAALAQGGGD
ncbi:glutathione S-transferase [Pseudophaeobacter sp.]|uniref:glutathione S-transferase family protein n=1 Tax=Pseudophaeobacter sp. TaxID=1971739 RepID=UPI003297FB55